MDAELIKCESCGKIVAKRNGGILYTVNSKGSDGRNYVFAHIRAIWCANGHEPSLVAESEKRSTITELPAFAGSNNYQLVKNA